MLTHPVPFSGRAHQPQGSSMSLIDVHRDPAVDIRDVLDVRIGHSTQRQCSVHTGGLCTHDPCI